MSKEEPETNHSFDINFEAFFPSHEAYEKYQENIEEDKKYIIDNFEVVSWRFNNPEYINKLNAEEVEKIIRDIESCRISEEEIKQRKKTETDNAISTAFNTMTLIGESTMPKDDQIVFRNVCRVSNTLEQHGMTPSNAMIVSGVLGLLAIEYKHKYPDVYKEWKESRGIKDDESSEETSE